MQETWVQSLGQVDPLEKGVATHSSVAAWRIPWTEEPGVLQFMGSQRLRPDRAAQETLLVPDVPGRLLLTSPGGGHRCCEAFCSAQVSFHSREGGHGPNSHGDEISETLGQVKASGCKTQRTTQTPNDLFLIILLLTLLLLTL